jgi:multidrug resistance efflux pump
LTSFHPLCPADNGGEALFRLERRSYDKMIHDACASLSDATSGLHSPRLSDGQTGQKYAQAQLTLALLQEIQERNSLNMTLKTKAEEKRSLQVAFCR